MSKQPRIRTKRNFFWSNLLKGLATLALMMLLFIAFKKTGGTKYIEWLEPIYSKPVLMFLIFTASELIIGLIPPEIFMIWGLSRGGPETYISIVALLGVISYLAGWIAYFVGKRGHNTLWYRFLKRKYFSKYEIYFSEYGGFLLIVAAATPLPYSAVCMLVGATGFKRSKFLLYSLSRIARYALYGFIVWEANTI
jgi:membrane protein DedA with SNARE-associated domain